MLYYIEVGLSHREVPEECSICIYISGCKNSCAHCHYSDLQRIDYGEPLSEHYNSIIDLYLRKASCVCFLGEGAGTYEEQNEFTDYVEYAHARGLKVCLYSGRDVGIESWMYQFDYLKLGSYKVDLGGLDSATTNQRLYRKDSDRFIDITSVFWNDGSSYLI